MVSFFYLPQKNHILTIIYKNDKIHDNINSLTNINFKKLFIMKSLSIQKKRQLWRIPLVAGIITGLLYFIIFLCTGELSVTKEIILIKESNNFLGNLLSHKINLPFNISRLWDIVAIPIVIFIIILFHKIISDNSDYANEEKKNNYIILISLFIFLPYLLFFFFIINNLGMVILASILITTVNAPIIKTLDSKNPSLFLIFFPWLLLIAIIGIANGFIITAIICLIFLIILLFILLLKKYIKNNGKKGMDNFTNWIKGK